MADQLSHPGSGVGGWQFSTIYKFLSGAQVAWGNSVYQGDGSWKDFHNKPHQYEMTNSGFNIATILNAVTNKIHLYLAGTQCVQLPYVPAEPPPPGSREQLRLLRPEELPHRRIRHCFRRASTPSTASTVPNSPTSTPPPAQVPSATSITLQPAVPALLQGGLHLVF